MLFAPISEIFVPDHMLNLGKMFSSCKSGCGSMGQIFSQATVIPIIPISHLAFLNLLFLMSSLLKYMVKDVNQKICQCQMFSTHVLLHASMTTLPIIMVA